MTTYFVGNYYEQTGSTVTKYYYAGSQRVAMRKNGTLNFLLGDHLGSSSLTTDANGVVISEMRYTPWGEVRYNAGTTPTDYTYTGQYSNTADFGLMFYNARWYDPYLGRMAQADTIIPPGVQGLDRYAYVNNSPLNFVDPTGHKPDCDGDGWCGDYSSNYSGGDANIGLTWRQRNLIPLNNKPACSEENMSIVCNNHPANLDVALCEDCPSFTSTSFPIYDNENANPATEFEIWYETYKILSLISEAENYGRPIYKQIKYIAPLGGLEYGIDAGLQVYDDRNKNLSFGQIGFRAGIRGVESIVADGFSTAAGVAAGIGTGSGAGYPFASYSTSAIIDNFFTNNVNPVLFNYLGGP